MRERSLQAKLHGAVVLCRQLVGPVHQRIGEDDARRKTADAGDDVARQHRLPVVEVQEIAQRAGLPTREDSVRRRELNAVLSVQKNQEQDGRKNI